MDYSWVPLSFSLALITAFGALVLKYIGTNYSKERDTSIIVGLITALLAGILAFIILCINKNKVKKVCTEINNNKKPIKWAIILMAIIFIANVCLTIYTLNKVENPAYAQIIKNTNVVFILLLSILIFKTKVNMKCILGVLLCLTGIGIIIFNN
tara:strand:- start:1536 stop:1997 length:462 start_codon:yes stop_codon:yes gene_type:complete